MHKYNNQDHAMMTAMPDGAETSYLGERRYDVWTFNEGCRVRRGRALGAQEGWAASGCARKVAASRRTGRAASANGTHPAGSGPRDGGGASQDLASTMEPARAPHPGPMKTRGRTTTMTGFDTVGLTGPPRSS